MTMEEIKKKKFTHKIKDRENVITYEDLFLNTYLLLVPKAIGDISQYRLGTFENWNLIDPNILKITLKQILKFIYKVQLLKAAPIVFVVPKRWLDLYQKTLAPTKHLVVTKLEEAVSGSERYGKISAIIFVGKIPSRRYSESLRKLNVPLVVIGRSLAQVSDYSSVVQTKFFSSAIFLNLILKNYLIMEEKKKLKKKKIVKPISVKPKSVSKIKKVNKKKKVKDKETIDKGAAKVAAKTNFYEIYKNLKAKKKEINVEKK